MTPFWTKGILQKRGQLRVSLFCSSKWQNIENYDRTAWGTEILMSQKLEVETVLLSFLLQGPVLLDGAHTPLGQVSPIGKFCHMLLMSADTLLVTSRGMLY